MSETVVNPLNGVVQCHRCGASFRESSEIDAGFYARGSVRVAKMQGRAEALREAANDLPPGRGVDPDGWSIRDWLFERADAMEPSGVDGV